MTNPLFAPSTLEYSLPDFANLKDEHFAPAFDRATAAHNLEIQAILEQLQVTFENTLVALEKSGGLLSQVMHVFYNKSSSDTNEQIQALEKELFPRYTAHNDAILLNPALFERLTKLEQAQEEGSLSLDPESQRLLAKYLEDFRFAGAELSEAQRDRVKEINERCSTLESEFDQKVLADANDLALNLPDDSRLSGLSKDELSGLRQSAADRNQTGYTIPLLNYSGHPLLASLTGRELRHELMERTLSKCSRGNENDTSSVIKELLTLRQEKAKLFGYANYSEYVTAQQTAKSPKNIHDVLRRIAPVARKNAEAEAKELAKFLKAETGTEDLQSWDWDRYTEQLRAEKYAIDTAVLKPYFELKRVLEDGVFFAAGRLFGLRFERRTELTGYHPDNWIYEVFYEDDSKAGLYLFDPFARTSKHGGAWMNNLVDQSDLLGKLPIVVNNLNIPKPAAGNPALMTFDEVNTLFHEFGHTLHGMLSKVTYPRFSGTNVERDFVEFPSQVNEMWMLWPEVLQNYAIHHETGEKLGLEWIDKLNATETFNQGFETTHYLQAAILDLAYHEAESVPENLVEFEAKAIADYGLDFAAVPTRYKTNYFSHIFAGGYSSGYYGYIWSEVLDAASVNWFKANGGLTRENGERFSKGLLSRGGSVDSMQLVRELLGEEPSIEPLLKRRGLL
ncbi:MAG: M3 family metallopeptidase [Aquiluna sp.]|nr:M3 family metallopeptidase [Aquiluna sp.]MCF8545221.1 M3 family metallopeptidase [Aquiluna sp.]